MALDSSLISVLSLAFGLGMVHALDADHIAAVSSLACRRFRLRDSLGFSVRWALGHGLTLIGLGLLVFVAGMAIPPEFTALAEQAVALVLIGLGVWVIVSLWSQRAHIHFHHHDDLPAHAHWHAHDRHTSPHPEHHVHKHTAVMIGVATLLSRPERKQLVELARSHSLLISGLFTGVVMMATYGLVLASMAYVTNVSYVAAFRQLSIPIGAVLGLTIQKEPRYLPKLVGIVIVSIGLVLVGIG